MESRRMKEWKLAPTAGINVEIQHYTDKTLILVLNSAGEVIEPFEGRNPAEVYDAFEPAMTNRAETLGVLCAELEKLRGGECVFSQWSDGVLQYPANAKIPEYKIVCTKSKPGQGMCSAALYRGETPVLGPLSAAEFAHAADQVINYLKKNRNQIDAVLRAVAKRFDNWED